MSLGAQSSVTPIIQQPQSSTEAPPGSVPVNGVTIRNLKDSQQDAEFAGRLKIEAFKGKYVYNITERKLPIAIKNLAANHRGQDQAFYNRTFVAELEGRPVGLLQLKFKDDKEIEKDDHVSELGCWHAWRYRCCIMGATDVDKNTKCYLDHISVDESARGKGVGKVLMQRTEYEARSRNCSNPEE
ncbi:uncharacterized protein LOC128556563 [Mercenaria mercenaria]|uniref:uncharacterized protein LOC128556563 n=1 Tax=Mercenaria mercenaria TaxID=6596 RepID=UPI00234F5490|nr:uncharacterized protein LOC128556563 [Mercenaria mercenaria]